MEDQNNTFWGLILQPGKRYEQVVEKSFHVSMAALDISGGNDKATVQVMINVDGQEFIVCHLSKNRNPQQTLDLNFQGGDSLALYVDGQSPQPVHLTGFYNEMDDDDDMEGLEMSDMSDEEEVPELIPAKLASAKKAMLKAKQAGKGDGEAAAKRKGSPVKESPQKKTKLQQAVEQEEDSDDDEDDDEEGEEEEDDEDEEGEDEEVEEGFSDEAEDDDEDDDDDEEDDDDDDDDEDDDEEEVDEPPIPLKKSKSPAAKKDLGQANGVVKTSETPKKKGAAAEQAQKTPVQQEKKAAQTPKSAKKTIGGGVMIEDLIPGSGPVAKKGRPVSVYYIGRLKQNNKQFDQTTGGPGFKFRLGGKEVIKGWDVGVEGMKVGGKRRITCPPHMAYGARGSPPVIPPNSVLVFDVTLKNVH